MFSKWFVNDVDDENTECDENVKDGYCEKEWVVWVIGGRWRFTA